MKYSITTVYSDCMKVEHSNDIVKTLNAAAIYLMDPDCCAITIFDFENKNDILNFER